MSAVLLQQLYNGLANGVVYALLAVALVVLVAAMDLTTPARGMLVLVGALLVLFGIDLAVTGTIVRRMQGIPYVDYAIVPQSLGVGGVSVLWTPVVAIAAGLILIVSVLLVARSSSWGLSIRARSDNREAATMLGIRTRGFAAVGWLVAVVLAGAAVLLMITQGLPGAGLEARAVAFMALPAAVLGGLGSMVGAAVAGLVVGLPAARAAHYLPAGFATTAVFLLMALVLLVRPAGLYETVQVSRV